VVCEVPLELPDEVFESLRAVRDEAKRSCVNGSGISLLRCLRVSDW